LSTPKITLTGVLVPAELERGQRNFTQSSNITHGWRWLPSCTQPAGRREARESESRQSQLIPCQNTLPKTAVAFVGFYPEERRLALWLTLPLRFSDRKLFSAVAQRAYRRFAARRHPTRRPAKWDGRPAVRRGQALRTSPSRPSQRLCGIMEAMKSRGHTGAPYLTCGCSGGNAAIRFQPLVMRRIYTYDALCGRELVYRVTARCSGRRSGGHVLGRRTGESVCLPSRLGPPPPAALFIAPARSATWCWPIRAGQDRQVHGG
jgi:hypothetical protein